VETKRRVHFAPDLNIIAAQPQDWPEEYLRLCMAVKVVKHVDDAITHINRHSTKHSDCIVTHEEANARRFLRLVDSAAVYWNASTRFKPTALSSALARRWESARKSCMPAGRSHW
jgi:glutamate-5-semialdehyde dehydrogenase